MIINRIGAQASHETFTIKPILELLGRYVNGEMWIDPFANKNSPATITNDHNPEMPTDYHEDYRDFLEIVLKKYMQVHGMLIDPPFGPRQIQEHYKFMGMKPTQEDTQGFYWKTWNYVIKILPLYVIQFGWHSNGRKEYYECIETLLVPHGGGHNDTICTVWKRRNDPLWRHFP